MKNTEIRRDETPHRSIKPLLTVNPFKRLLAATAGILLATGGILSAQVVYSVNIVGCIPDWNAS